MNNKEFFNLCGQLVKYIATKSDAKEKHMDVITPFINSQNSKILKERIIRYFEKNSFRLFLNSKVLNEAMNKISAFDRKVKFDFENKAEFIAGLTTNNNIFYQKTNKKEDDQQIDKNEDE